MSESDFIDRRSEQRRRTLKAARIIIDKRSTISCLVRNISAHGSRLALESVIGIPQEFVLDIFGEPPRQARLVWRSANEVGVALV